jgi:hypothetical protein
VSTSELGQLEALLERVLANPSGYLETVMQQLMERLGDVKPDSPPTVLAGYDVLAHEELADHNLLLAAALGACDCWGADPQCPVCEGAGASGWTDPDPGLFAEFVAPAVARAAARSQPAQDHAHHRQPVDVPGRDQSSGGPRKESADD